MTDLQGRPASQPPIRNLCLSLFGRYQLPVSFKKPISIPAIQSCNICNEITVSTRPSYRSQYFLDRLIIAR